MKKDSFISKSIRFFKNSPRTTIGVILILIILIMTLGANLFTVHDPLTRYAGEWHSAPSVDHILGTTRLGRDVFAQTLYGGRVSLMVGCLAGAISVSISLLIGVAAGYFGGVIDGVISTIINIMLVIPSIVLLLVIASMLGGVSPVTIGIIIGITSWPFSARVLRAQTMSIRNREFVYSAEIMGEKKLRILLVEILPNMLSLITSGFVSTVIRAILAMTFLEFIGFGDSLSVTWGTMLYNAQKSGALNSGIWWEMLGPSAAIVLFGAGMTLINFSIDEISNPKLRAQRIMSTYNKIMKKNKKKKLMEEKKNGITRG